MRKLLFIPILLICSVAYSAPTITGYNQETGVVSGSDFGSHADYGGSEDYLCKAFNDFETNLTEDGLFTVAFNFDDQWTLESGSFDDSTYARRFRNAAGSDDARGGLQLSIADNDTGEYYSFFKFRFPQNTTGKFFRMYWGDSSSEDNYWFSPNSGNEQVYGTSEYPGSTTQTGTVDALSYGDWHTIEIIGLTESGVVNSVKIFLDGNEEFEATNWFGASYDSGGGLNWIHIGHMVDDAVANDEYDFDDYYTSWTQARVVIGDASTLSACTNIEIQVPTVWSTTSVATSFNQGSFSNGETAYVFVIDSDGVASTGFPVTIGCSSTPISLSGTIQASGNVNFS